MRFLIDECLHTSLIQIAHSAGHAADHVNYVGLSGKTDWELMVTIRREGYTFVTNNRTDFLTLHASEELHAGIIIIVPNVIPSIQRQLLAATLAHIGSRNIDNTVIEAGIQGKEIHFREYPLHA